MKLTIKCTVGICLALACLTLTVSGEEKLLPGGKSPSGRYAIYVCQGANRNNDSVPGNYSFQLVETKNGKRLKTSRLEMSRGGYDYFTSVSAEVLWHKSEQVFAITNRETKRTNVLYLCAIEHGELNFLKIPDYWQNALGRVGTTKMADRCWTSLIKWEKNLLWCNLVFESSDRRRYETNFALDVWPGGNNYTPEVSLFSMDTPELGGY